MGNFEDHIRYGTLSFSITTILSFGLAYFFQWPYQLIPAVLPLAFGATIFGALTPDIDHHNSHPHRTVKNAVPFFTASAILVVGYLYFTQISTFFQQSFINTLPNPTVVIGFTIFIIAMVTATLIRRAIVRFRPSHRGVTHSHSFNIAITVLFFCCIATIFSAANLNMFLTISISALVSGGFSIGFLSHQYCDGMLF